MATNTQSVTPDSRPTSQASTPGTRGRVLRGLRFLQVRLRFIGVVAVLFIVVGKWDVLRNYWGRTVRWMSGRAVAEAGVSPDTQYFCPMCPGVLSLWPAKCPVCYMPLVRREVGDAALLPEGVTARMQFSPYRLQLAGIRTSPVAYRPLAREVTAIGVVRGPAAGAPEAPAAGESTSSVDSPPSPAPEKAPSGVLVEAELALADAANLRAGAAVEIANRELPARGPWLGTVREIESLVAALSQRVRVLVDVECPPGELPTGALVEARFETSLAEIEPFRSLPRDPPARQPRDPRTLYACPDHADVLALQPGKCPRDDLELLPQTLAENERVSFWCPMHPEVTAAEDGRVCEKCQGMKLLPRVTAYAPPGQVLAVPESAIIDTGKVQVVYVETGPGMFDGVEVKLGPRADGFASVLQGLSAGQRVAAAGAFLIDAETRLNPHLAAAYFGAGDAGKAAPSHAPPSQKAKPKRDLLAELKLSPADRALAERQKVCPVSKLPLGSMGELVRMKSKGRVVFLCCEGCRAQFEESEKAPPP